MIEHIRGKVLKVAGDELVIECSGLGLRARVFEGTRFHKYAGRSMILPAWLEIAPRRLHLYGFIDERERGRFIALISIPGIGPATAMRLLAHYSELLEGRMIPRISGVGPAKQARVARWIRKRGGSPASPTLAKELRQALRGLGLRPAQAALASARALAAAPAASLEELIRLAVSRK